MKKSLLTIGTLGILLLSTLVSADISLGSIADVDSLTLSKGKIGEFKVSLFNLGDKPLYISLNAEYPREVKVEIHPKKLTLESEITGSPNAGGEWFVLRDGRTYVRTYPVYVYVKIPPEISKNLYKIKLIVTASDLKELKGKGITQNLAQVREITFTAYVPGSVDRDVEIEDQGYIKEDLDLKSEYEKNMERESIEMNEGTEEKRDTATVARSEGIDSEYPERTGVGVEDRGTETRKETGKIGITRDEAGGTNINLPTGQITMSKEETETAIDIGLITLVISVGSLILRILK